MRVSEDRKTRDPIARALRTPRFRTRTVADQRRRTGRKAKHRRENIE